MRKVGAESIVLLKNENGILPLQTSNLKKVVVVGGNARQKVLSGGGSAALKTSFFRSPYDGIVDALKDQAKVTYHEGAVSEYSHHRIEYYLLMIDAYVLLIAYMKLPTLEDELILPGGERGWQATWYAHEHQESMVPLREVYKTHVVDETRMFISTSAPEGITRRWTLILEGSLRPCEEDCRFEFGLTVAGRAKVYFLCQNVVPMS
jgi:beta-glucosidase